MSDFIVRKATVSAPQHRTLPKPHFEKLKHGEPFVAECHVRYEMLGADNMMLKRAVAFSNLPGAADWEFISDEPASTGGDDSAPAPLVYFSVGLGFCFMTHAKIVAMNMDLEVERITLEQRSCYETNFMTGAVSLDDVYGKSKAHELHVLIESDEPKSRLSGFIKWCEQSCMAMQTISQAAPTQAVIFLNGERLETVSKNQDAGRLE